MRQGVDGKPNCPVIPQGEPSSERFSILTRRL